MEASIIEQQNREKAEDKQLLADFCQSLGQIQVQPSKPKPKVVKIQPEPAQNTQKETLED